MQKQLLSAIVLLACVQASGAAENDKARGNKEVDAARIGAAASDADNWLTTGRTYYEERFSPLTQINDANVGKLGLAWIHDFGSTIGLEATPLVADGVLYTSGVWNILHAIDAKTGKALWSYDPQVPRYWMRYMCCGPANRGPALWKGKIFEGTIDGRLIAVDAKTGKLLWSTQTTDTSKPYSITGAPRVIKGKVIIGNGGAEFGTRGYVSAYDAETGKQVWRFYIVPGDPSKGFESKTLEMAAKTWSGQWWTIGAGGNAWDGFAHDPELDLLYIGTGNGSPWSRDLRSPGGGDNLFLSSIVAVRPDTGEYVWHYQEVPGENWDYTAVQPISLADLTIDGKPRKVLLHAPKNGFFYVIDRTNGKLISANNFVPVNWATHIDLATGRPVENKALLYDDKQQVTIYPAHFGAHNWQPMSYSPITKLVYLPAQETSYGYSRVTKLKPVEMNWNSGLGFNAKPPADTPPPNKGYLLAWNPVTQKAAWRVDHAGVWNGGTLTTAGNLVVQGAGDGRFVVYSADAGKKLWEMPIQTGAVAGPISYSVDGEQYIAVNAGWAGSIAIIGGMAPTHRATSRVLAFKLGGTAKLPPVPDRGPLTPPPQTASPETIAKGEALYRGTCRLCHGLNGESGGMTPDLRYMSAETHKAFNDIVLYGARAKDGMAPFADMLKPEDSDAIHAYLIDRAWAAANGAKR
jgi:quinohemoprotein ethanol dehydrogenase